MRALLLVLSLLLAAPFPAPAQELGEERAVFTMSVGDSLVVVDSMIRTGDRLVSRATNFHRARFLIEADLRDDASIERIHVVIWPWDRAVEDEPAVDVTLKPVGRILMREMEDGELASIRKIEAGTFPYVSPSLAIAEQEILHARALADGDDEVFLPMWSPYGETKKGSTWTDTIEFVEPDSVRISGWNETVSTFALDDDGRIDSGTIAPTGYTIERSPLPAE